MIFAKNLVAKARTLIAELPIKAMTTKAIEKSEISPKKVVETLVKNNVQPTLDNVTNVIEKIKIESPVPLVVNQPQIKQIQKQELQINTNNQDMAKKPNFFQNLWAKTKGVVSKVVQIGGNVVGGLIGIPGAGNALSNLVDKIPVAKMAQKAAAAGKVDTKKVAETLAASGIQPTDNNVNVAVSDIKKVAAQDPSITNVQKPSDLGHDTAGLSTMGKIMDFAKKHWYVPLAVVAAAVYFLFIRKKGRRY